MNSQASAVLPETLGLIVREYLKALRPESSARTAGRGRTGHDSGESNVPRERASARLDGHFSAEVSEAFCRPARAKR
jgi:hypothetical protein